MGQRRGGPPGQRGTCYGCGGDGFRELTCQACNGRGCKTGHSCRAGRVQVTCNVCLGTGRDGENR